MQYTLKLLVAVKSCVKCCWLSLVLLAWQQKEQAWLCDWQEALLWFCSLNVSRSLCFLVLLRQMLGWCILQNNLQSRLECLGKG